MIYRLGEARPVEGHQFQPSPFMNEPVRMDQGPVHFIGAPSN